MYDYYEISSGIRDQPSNLDEICEGAINRAINSFDGCDFSVGLEAGVYFVKHAESQYLNTCICVIYDGQRIRGIGQSSGFEHPQKVISECSLGKEIGLVYEKLSGKIGIAQREGAIGLLSNGKLVRRQYTQEAVRNALLPLFNKELYEK